MSARSSHRPPTVEEQLRVEVVDPAHHHWPAVHQQMVRSGHGERLMELTPAGPLSARQSVVAAFLGGRVVAHACFRVEPTRSPAGSVTVVARLDGTYIDPPFVGTTVERILMGLAESRARTMGCRGLTTAHRDALLAA